MHIIWCRILWYIRKCSQRISRPRMSFFNINESQFPISGRWSWLYGRNTLIWWGLQLRPWLALIWDLNVAIVSFDFTLKTIEFQLPIITAWTIIVLSKSWGAWLILVPSFVIFKYYLLENQYGGILFSPKKTLEELNQDRFNFYRFGVLEFRTYLSLLSIEWKYSENDRLSFYLLVTIYNSITRKSSNLWMII